MKNRNTWATSRDGNATWNTSLRKSPVANDRNVKAWSREPCGRPRRIHRLSDTRRSPHSQDGPRELVNSNLRGAHCLIKQRPTALRDDVCHFYANYMYVCRWWRRATRLRRRIGRRNALMQASILVAVIHTASPCRLKCRCFTSLRFRYPFTSSLYPSLSYPRSTETNPSPYISSSLSLVPQFAVFTFIAPSRSILLFVSLSFLLFFFFSSFLSFNFFTSLCRLTPLTSIEPIEWHEIEGRKVLCQTHETIYWFPSEQEAITKRISIFWIQTLGCNLDGNRELFCNVEPISLSLFLTLSLILLEII